MLLFFFVFVYMFGSEPFLCVCFCATLICAPLIFLEMVMVSLRLRVHRNLKEVAVFRHSSKKVNKEDGTVLDPCFLLYTALARLFLLYTGET